MKKTIGSIVVYNPHLTTLKKTICTFLDATPDSKVYIWDNSSADNISKDLNDVFGSKIQYIKSQNNIGYGRGNNAVFQNINESFDYFCVLNPDLEIPKVSISEITSYLEQNANVGLVSCIIKGQDGSIHEVHKYLPSFGTYLKKLFLQFTKLNRAENNLIAQRINGEPFSLPIISGCFMFFTKDHYKDMNGFDDRFFLYFEDYDISVRSFIAGKSIILPQTYIIHGWARSSHRNLRLFWIHLKSGLTFYSKWGWTGACAKKINSL